jgi:hypothetical protein
MATAGASTEGYPSSQGREQERQNASLFRVLLAIILLGVAATAVAAYRLY